MYNEMRQQLLVFLILFFITTGFSQSRILVFHKTNGFRHTGAINNGITMFEDLGNENNDWITDNSMDSSVFTTANLAQYDVIVFLNTSGSDEAPSEDGDLLSASEKIVFENFMASGKGFIGIHAATDTYRDGVWPFYNELVGGIVQTSPNHTSNNFNADIEVKTSHPIVDFLGAVGSIWNKDEEYYYWETNGGQLSIDNTVLLEVESTGSNSYDTARPITWYKESITYDDDNNDTTPDVTISGFRSFYTALGHKGSDYNNDANFRTLLKNATLWALGNALSVEENVINDFRIVPNPIKDIAKIHLGNISDDVSLKIYDVLGKQELVKVIRPNELYNRVSEINLTNFNKGVYLFKLTTKHVQRTFKVIKL